MGKIFSIPLVSIPIRSVIEANFVIFNLGVVAGQWDPKGAGIYWTFKMTRKSDGLWVLFNGGSQRTPKNTAAGIFVIVTKIVSSEEDGKIVIFIVRVWRENGREILLSHNNLLFIHVFET